MLKNIVTGLVLSLFLLTAANAAEFNNNLKFGSKGNDVKKLQEFLAEQELYSGPITGNFFSLTLKSVKAFQTREHISPVSGFFGVLTRTKVNQILDEQLVESEAEGLMNQSATTTDPTLGDVVNKLQDQINATKEQSQALQNSLNQIASNTQSALDVQRAATDAEAARLRAIELAKQAQDARNQAALDRLPLYTSEEMLVKYGGAHGDTAGQLLSLGITSTTVKFSRQGSADKWGNAKVVFNGRTYLTKYAGGFDMVNGEYYQCAVDDFCYGYAPGLVRGLTPQTRYTYQIVLPTPGRADSVFEGAFYTPFGDQNISYGINTL